MAQQGQSEAPLQRLRILILGAGGHAQVVADILQCMGHVDPAVVSIGYLDDNPSLAGRVILDLPVLGALARLPNIEHDAIVVAIGDNLTRGQLYERLRAQGERFALAIHPRATVARDVTIGSGSMLCAGAIVNPGSVVGVNCILNTGCSVDHHNRIGDHVHIAPGVHLGGEVQIGDGALIGIGSTVMPRCRVGEWSVVAAGAVVHKDVPDRAVVAGVPARVVRRL